jgi:hypothetical protein
MVKSRLEKARSFGKRRKTKEGIDIDLLVKAVMDKLGEDTLGKFYREKILTHKPLRIKSLPKVSGEVIRARTLWLAAFLGRGTRRLHLRNRSPLPQGLAGGWLG